MATLDGPNGETIVLLARHLMGRSRSMHTTLRHSDVSGEHAVVVWGGVTWKVRDLGSRNGTYLNGRRLEGGESVALAEGDVLALGIEQHVFKVTSVAAPSPVAWCGDLLVEGDGELLALPSGDDPEVVVWADADSGWLVQRGDSCEQAFAGMTLAAGGRSWRIELPQQLSATRERQDLQEQGPQELHFRVSHDEEYVEVDLMHGGEVHKLKPRAHHYLLLTLARARIEDAEAGVAVREQGWLALEDLARMLRITLNHIHVSIYRARKEVTALGVSDPHELVELRATSRQVRLGVAQLKVTRLE